MQILLIDDSALVRFRLSELLAELDHVKVVGQAATVAEATAAIPKLKPDVVLLDLLLPDGNGIAVLEAVKGLPAPPIVGVLTNYPSEQFRARCLAAGADFFLDKSKQFEEIPVILRQLEQGRTR